MCARRDRLKPALRLRTSLNEASVQGAQVAQKLILFPRYNCVDKNQLLQLPMLAAAPPLSFSMGAAAHDSVSLEVLKA